MKNKKPQKVVTMQKTVTGKKPQKVVTTKKPVSLLDDQRGD